MILIVDDLQENIYSLKSVLEYNHFKVDTAQSGEEALRKVLKNDYVLILLDVHMPEMDGFEVAEILSGYSKAKDTAIIFISANYTDNAFIAKGYQFGGIDYITKPVDPTILLMKVKTFYSLYETRQENQKIFDNSSDIICSISENGQFLTLNKSIQAILGYSAEELIGESYLKLIHPQELSRNGTLFAPTSETQTLVQRFLHNNGQTVAIQWSISWSPRDKTFFCIGRDISTQQEKEQALLESERRFKALVENSADITAVIDQQGTVLFLSSTVEKYLGFDSNYYLSKSAFNYIHPEDKASVTKAIFEVEPGYHAHVGPYRTYDDRNQWKWFTATVTNKLDDPVINGIIINALEITPLIEKEQTILEQNKKLREIAIINSHLIRKPVANVLGLATLLKEEATKGELKDEVIDMLAGAANELDGIIKSIAAKTEWREEQVL